MLLEKYKNKNEVLANFCTEQIERIKDNRNVQFFSNDIGEFENVLKAVYALYMVEKETYLRDFSIQVFRDSKPLSKYLQKSPVCFLITGIFRKGKCSGELEYCKEPYIC